jgi:hypothetical protein
MALDPRIETIRETYGLSGDDFWELPQKKGTWLVKHSALEIVAVKSKLWFSPPQIVEANGADGYVAVCVSGTLGERVEWSIGEASPKNSKNAYPWAMAEKRAKDRVILKLTGIHGLVYSEDEMSGDDKTPAVAAPMQQISSYRAKQLLKTDVLLEEIDKAATTKRCDELADLFRTELAFLPSSWSKQFMDRIDQRRVELAQPAVTANETLDRQFAETIRQ